MLGCCLNSFHFLWVILSTSTVLIPVFIPLASSELTNLPGKVQKEVSSSLEQSEQPVLEEVCVLDLLLLI